MGTPDIVPDVTSGTDLGHGGAALLKKTDNRGERKMKRRGIVVTIAAALVFLCAPLHSQAGDDLLASVGKGCEKELVTYCKDVTPGEGRVLACLFAHGDKLSGRTPSTMQPPSWSVTWRPSAT